MTSDPSERRAFDAVLSRGHVRVAVEVVTRLTDVQAQVRPILLKQAAAHIPCMVLVLADSRLNARVVRDAAATLLPAFPIAPRLTLRCLRGGEAPSGNGYVLA